MRPSVFLPGQLTIGDSFGNLFGKIDRRDTVVRGNRLMSLDTDRRLALLQQLQHRWIPEVSHQNIDGRLVLELQNP